MRITAYDEAGGAIGAWPTPNGVELAYSINGPDQASVVVPRGSACLARDQLMPGNVGCFLEIDARDEGVPWPFVGRVTTLEQGSQGTARRVGIVGPRAWLEKESVPASATVTAPASRIMQRVVDAHPNCLWLRVPDSEEAADDAAPLILEAQTVYGLMEELQSSRGLEFLLLPIPGRAPWFELQWRSPLGSRDRTSIRLEEGVNCDWDGAYSLDTANVDLIGLGRAFMAGSGHQAIQARAPDRVLGRREALTAVVSPVLLAQLLGGTESTIQLGAGTRDALEATVATLLRRQLSPVIAATVRVTDTTNLWGELLPGDLVSVHFASDDTGIMDEAVARVRTLTVSPIPPLAMTLSVELWEV